MSTLFASVNVGNVENVAVGEAAEVTDEALTLADPDTRDLRRLGDDPPIVHHLLAAKPTRTSQVVDPEVATTVDDLQRDP
ncbi:uncharacterized protein A1O9_03378 [Exophiala aquamarina CBS 119918]|uniref:Uncharacterized protein n=1 Tax=Exophiala aquamarina CBS 119918 TaxID=1182545 RepID=A0A072PR75_9EURO|nr:uncharacterized protein A1O9_03378 [Exophiala aquamarina CBS 119918]KEF61808.1 hypothetical protein A1O9_03378 [Exophiala aquamarina CBS 119918]